MTARLHILGRKEAREAVDPHGAALRPVAIVSISGEEPAPRELRALGVPLLGLRFDDVPRDLPKHGYNAPTREHIEALLTWWEALGVVDGDVVVHCAQGVSRSSACALAMIAAPRSMARALDPNVREVARLCVLDLLASTYASRQRGVRGSQEVYPNLRIVWLADQVLGWDGHLLAAVEDVFAMRGLWVDLGEEPPPGWPGRAG